MAPGMRIQQQTKTILLVNIAARLLGAYASEDCGVTQQPLVIGQTFLAGSADPTAGSTAWALTSHGIAEKLFTVDQAGDVVPGVAKRITKLAPKSWEVKVKAGYKFSDGTPVTAQSVAVAMTQINSANPGNAQASVGAMTWTARDTETLRLQSERDTPVMDAVLAEWCFVVFRNETVKTGKTIFTGPFAIEKFMKGDRFSLTPNLHYPGAADRDPLVIKKFSDGQAVVKALENSELDMGFHLPATSLAQLRQRQGITVKSFEVGYHYMMWHNIRRAPLSDLNVRKAVDLILDRSQLTQTLLGGDPTRSLFPANTPWRRPETQPHADKSQAEQLLDQSGWTLDSSGKRTKDGAPLTLTIVAYPQRPGLALMLPVVAQTLTNVGITVNSILTDGASWDQLDKIMADKDYDLLMWAQNTLPAGDPQWFLNAFFRSDGGNNHAGLNSPEVDSQLDGLASTGSHAERVTAVLAAHNAILGQVPVSNLMTPAWHVGLSARLSQYVPWGSDYYVVRADTEPKLCTTVTTTAKNIEDNVDGAAGLSSGLCPAALVALMVLRPTLGWA